VNKREQSAGPQAEGGCSREVIFRMFFSGASLWLLKCPLVQMENTLKVRHSLMPILASHPEKGMRILRGQVTYVQICFLGVRGSAKAFVALEAFQYTLGLLIKITYFSF